MKRKKSWGPSNPLWRYLHKKGSRSKRGRTRTMSRRRSYRRSRSGLSGGSIMGIRKPNIIPPMVVMAAAGLGAAMVANKFIGSNKIPFQDNVVGFLAGGPIGAIAPFLLTGVKAQSSQAYIN